MFAAEHSDCKSAAERCRDPDCVKLPPAIEDSADNRAAYQSKPKQEIGAPIITALAQYMVTFRLVPPP